jgi:hypothetical protein
MCWQVNRLMDLIVHSLYSNKEVFLRELVRWVTSQNGNFSVNFSVIICGCSCFLYQIYVPF